MSMRKQKKAEKAIAQATFLFDKLPSKCTGCTKPFDKHSKEAATDWTVNVFKESEKVKVYCPDCWKDVTAWAEDFEKQENQNV